VDGDEVRVSTTQVYDPLTQILHLVGTKRWSAGGKEQVKTTQTALRRSLTAAVT
jgi:hypothetical protein